MTEKTRVVININGIVQGVGFRPFVYNLAHSCHVSGWVNNFPGGVRIDAEGKEQDIERFIKRLKTENPPVSSIDTFAVESAKPVGYTDFEIRASSDKSAPEAYISSDISICDDCLNEMNDPGNRRYRYPFINCTNCGPRFTITTGIPYDRINTTMRVFPMCEDCAREYHGPSDRRFHAQPVACGKCGPSLFLLDAKGNKLARGEEIEKAIELLQKGNIVAVKGLGGYHLACDAKNAEAVRKLRKRKNRDGKPFALMAKNMAAILQYCFANKKEAELLQSIKKPIVLLDMKPKNGLACTYISPDNRKIGVLLPYTPLHHLLFTGELELIVMTSGNISGEPIYYKDDEALSGLCGIADYFLTHNREIFIRTDDSVTSVFRDEEYIIRRSRGYVPLPVDIAPAIQGTDRCIPSVLACGGELKNTFCLTKGNKAFLSHHIGDLENMETLDSFETGIKHFETIFSVMPEIVAFDKHPNYLSTAYAKELTGVVKIPVQHHHAHIASCMAENNVLGKVIGVAFDGTGYGDDGNMWGGEFFIGDYSGFERQAHFEYMPMPGGETAIKEPWRMALSLLVQAYGADSVPGALPFLRETARERVDIITQQIVKRINTPRTSSAGRLFDAAAALAGLCSVIEYEGQAAIRLETAAGTKTEAPYPYEIIPVEGMYQISMRQTVFAMVEDIQSGRETSRIASAFHCTVAKIILDVCRLLREKFRIDQVALSGGVFQNRLLMGLALDNLENDGFKVYRHGSVPANDGGISLGQAVMAIKQYMEAKNNE